MRCEYCKQSYDKTNKRGPVSSFCSRRCRDKKRYYNSLEREGAHKASKLERHTIFCKECGKLIDKKETYRTRKPKYCSVECAAKAKQGKPIPHLIHAEKLSKPSKESALVPQGGVNSYS